MTPITPKTLITFFLAAFGLLLGAQAATASVIADAGPVAVTNDRGQGVAPRYSDSVDGAVVANGLYQAPRLTPDMLEQLAAANLPATTRYSDSAEGALAAVNVPSNYVVAPTTSSGTEIEWPQVGIGFGIGMLLAFGLFVTLRLAHVRPLAH
jgi:hypothetical protein